MGTGVVNRTSRLSRTGVGVRFEDPNTPTYSNRTPTEQAVSVNRTPNRTTFAATEPNTPHAHQPNNVPVGMKGERP